MKYWREDLKIRISKYMSYLLRHDPEDLKMSENGFVSLGELLTKLKRKFPQVSEGLIREIVEKSERRRFEMKGGKIRALYGHSISIRMRLKEDKEVNVLYHGTTWEAAARIIRVGLKPMRRNWVHLSPTVEVARIVAFRRTSKPAILKIDARRARRDGIKFYKATEEVYLCKEIPPKYIELMKEW